jgi:hypothetical protein
VVLKNRPKGRIDPDPALTSQTKMQQIPERNKTCYTARSRVMQRDSSSYRSTGKNPSGWDAHERVTTVARGISSTFALTWDLRSNRQRI